MPSASATLSSTGRSGWTQADNNPSNAKSSVPNVWVQVTPSVPRCVGGRSQSSRRANPSSGLIGAASSAPMEVDVVLCHGTALLASGSDVGGRPPRVTSSQRICSLASAHTSESGPLGASAGVYTLRHGSTQPRRPKAAPNQRSVTFQARTMSSRR
jgi:hypothetical protein